MCQQGAGKAGHNENHYPSSITEIDAIATHPITRSFPNDIQEQCTVPRIGADIDDESQMHLTASREPIFPWGSAASSVADQNHLVMSKRPRHEWQYQPWARTC